MRRPMPPRLLALSDLHVAFPENRKLIEELRPACDEDWLLLAGDIGYPREPACSKAPLPEIVPRLMAPLL
jgi:predicted phosphodiesterase